MKLFIPFLIFFSINIFSNPVSNLSDICEPLGPYSETDQLVFTEGEIIKVMECTGYLRGVVETLSLRHQIYAYIEEEEKRDLSTVRMCSTRAMIELDKIPLDALGEYVYEKIQLDIKDGKEVLDQNSTYYVVFLLNNLCKSL
jgi:hypothetical protein